MKENAPKKTWFQTLRTLWVPLAIGVVTVAALAVVVGMVWKDYRTAMMDSQTRQMELVVQSTADSIRVLLEEYADRLDSIAEKAEAGKAFRPTVARSDTIRDVWLENSNGEVIYSCYGLSAVCDVLITRTEDISYWQYHSGDEHYLVMKKKAGGETACLVVDSTVMYQQLISEIHVGRNGYIMIKNDDNLVVMHPEAVQWGIKVVEGRQRIYQGKELDMSSLSELLRAQQEEESGTLDYYSYWWADPDLPRVHKISAFRHLDVGGSFWIVSAVVDYDDFYEPVQQSFVKVVLIFGGVALVLVLFMFQMFRLQEREQLQWGVDSKLRILAADDNNKVLDLLDKDLSALGLSVSTCSRRGELRQLLEQQPFDVLAIDESLMSSSGVDLCMAIRGRYPGMTRIVMTNAPTREIVDARSHGVIDGYVVKPVSASTLLAQIRSSRKE